MAAKRSIPDASLQFVILGTLWRLWTGASATGSAVKSLGREDENAVPVGSRWARAKGGDALSVELVQLRCRRDDRKLLKQRFGLVPALCTVVRQRLAPVVEAGIMPADVVLDYENAARRLYFEKPQCQRDEAIRSGAIAATAMMYAANALGLGSTPMIAFDPEPLAREFALSEDEVPVMLVAVGAKLPTNWPQKPRRPVADLLDFV